MTKAIILQMIRDMRDETTISKALDILCAKEYTAGLNAGREDQRSRSFNATHGHDMGQ